ncbi:MAG: polyprenyl synthetase family protein [Spirochaetaceae bacterium]|jgi:octaprenyl-diphosphate synthase|nr:polyprenyl synthetase family protein [Spirochaetaceae bacterium]
MNPQYKLRLEKIEALLGAVLPGDPPPSWIGRVFDGLEAALPPEPVRFLLEPGRDLFDRGGKRWRPLLMVLVCEALGGGDRALPLTPLVELPHTASLIHDDIEDNSEKRRGKPAVHLLYGVDTAINGACFLYFLSLGCIQSWDAPADLKNRVYAVWGEHMRRLHMGQAMDIRWHRDFLSLPAPEEYLLMCRLKTGVLARLSAVLGAYVAAGLTGLRPEAAGALAGALGDAAEKLGVGFQILDDVRNLTTGNPGKKRGDDIVEGKKSLPILLYLHRWGDAGAFVARCFSAARAGGTDVAEVEELIRALDGAGVIAEAKTRGLELIREAGSVFSGISLPDFPGSQTARDLLAGFTDLFN